MDCKTMCLFCREHFQLTYNNNKTNESQLQQNTLSLGCSVVII